MCRRNQLLAVGLLSFGLGLLVVVWIEAELLRWLLGIGLVTAGLALLKQK